LLRDALEGIVQRGDGTENEGTELLLITIAASHEGRGRRAFAESLESDEAKAFIWVQRGKSVESRQSLDLSWAKSKRKGIKFRRDGGKVKEVLGKLVTKMLAEAG